MRNKISTTLAVALLVALGIAAQPVQASGPYSPHYGAYGAPVTPPAGPRYYGAYGEPVDRPPGPIYYGPYHQKPAYSAPRPAYQYEVTTIQYGAPPVYAAPPYDEPPSMEPEPYTGRGAAPPPVEVFHQASPRVPGGHWRKGVMGQDPCYPIQGATRCPDVWVPNHR